MPDTRERSAEHEPVVDFDVNQIAPVGEHWSVIDSLQQSYDYFWTKYGHGHWVLTDPDAIREAFQRPDLFSSVSEVAAEPNPSYTFIPTNIDPPMHVKYRHVLNGWFSPKAVERLTTLTEEACRSVVTKLAGRDQCEFMSEFAAVYPTWVFLGSLGLPIEDIDKFGTWVRMIFDDLRNPFRAEQLGAALKLVRDYFMAALAKRRERPADPGTDFVAHLMSSTVDDRPLSDDEILNICVVLVMAGLETTSGQLGYMFHYLAGHDDARRQIIQTPDVVTTAVEEFLRIHTIVIPGRKVTADVDFHGCPMHQGEMVMLTIPAANRSPQAFDAPQDVRLDRPRNRHIAFGLGPHRCLGIHLARRELATALRVWHEVIPDYRIAQDQPLLERGGQLGLVSLPLVWD